MSEVKRSYYRNWYQQWQEEKKQEEKNQAMKYFTQVEDESQLPMSQMASGQLYIRQGQLYQKRQPMQGQPTMQGVPNYEEHPHYEETQYGHSTPEYEPYHPEMEYGPHMHQQSHPKKSNLSKKQMRQLQDVLRGLLVGLPVVLVLLMALYLGGFLPQNMLGGIFSQNDPAVVAYIETHDTLMSQHNALNQRIAQHITGGTLSPDVIANLQNEYVDIQAQTAALLADPNSPSFMNRLWSLKLQSLGQMMGIFETNPQVDDTVIATFNQFATDQNDIGVELTNGLSGLLTEHNIRGISIN